MKHSLFFLPVLLIVLHSCTRQEVSPRPYPRLATHAVTDISSDGAKFHGEVSFTTGVSFTQHGFVWSQKSNPNIYNSDTLSLGALAGLAHFSASVNRALLSGQTYYVRSYLRTADGFLVYGDIQSFVSQGSPTPYSVIGIENNTDLLPLDHLFVLGNFTDNVTVTLDGAPMTLIDKNPGYVGFVLPSKTRDGATMEVSINGTAYSVAKGPDMMLSFMHNLSPYASNFNFPMTASVGGMGYFGFGANTGNTYSYPSSTDSVYTYSPVNNQVNSLSGSHPAPRSAMVSFTVAGKVYVGGISGSQDFYSLNPATGQFTPLNDMPLATALKGFTLGEKGFVFFGTGATNNLYEYTPANDTWIDRSNGGVPVSTYVRTFDFSQGSIAYIADIHDPSSFQRFDATDNSWKKLKVNGLFYPTGLTEGSNIFASANGYTYFLYQYTDSNGIRWTGFSRFNASQEGFVQLPRITRQLFLFKSTVTINGIAYLITDSGIWKWNPQGY